MRTLLQKLHQLDDRLCTILPLLLALLLVVILRIPTFFEPYWYGDEAIYLTIGVALRQGARLYAEIIDHKTPLIYYLAMVPNQLWFRLLTTAWMLVTTTAFYYLAERLLKKTVPTTVATILFVLATSLPWFEGNIPNGELFVMGFILVGGIFFLQTPIAHGFLDQAFNKVVTLQSLSKTFKWYLAAGVFFGLAILTKVPALFDAAAFLAMAWFGFATSILTSIKQPKTWLGSLNRVSAHLAVVIGGVAATIIASVVYFVARGSGQAYLEYGLLYNFRYVQSWSLPFTDPVLQFLFTLPGKALLAGVIILALTALSKKLSPATQFAAGWFVLALFASLLSNRPYPHYFLQLAPAFSLLIGVCCVAITDLWADITDRKRQTNQFIGSLPLLITIGLISLTTWVLVALHVGLYSTASYYANTWKFLTGQMTTDAYHQSFNSLMHDNYQAAEIIAQSDNPHLFIWGTNPMLYALSQKSPTGRFTVSFHIHDFKAYDETIASVIEKQPPFIVVMDSETSVLPGLEDYLEENYVMNANFEHFDLWKRL